MKRFVLTLIIIISVFGLSSAIYADSEIEKAGADIKAKIEEDYQLHYSKSVESAKDEFSSEDNGTLHEVKLGDGIAYYKISEKNISSYIFAGYQFPLYFNGKQAGIIEANNDSGEWKISNISNISDLEEKIKNINKSKKGNGHLKLIDDKSYHVYVIYVNDADGERIIDLKNNKTSSVKAFNDSIIEIKKDKAGFDSKNEDGLIYLKGSSYESSNELTTAHILFALAILCMIPLVYLFIKKRTGNTHN